MPPAASHSEPTLSLLARISALVEGAAGTALPADLAGVIQSETGFDSTLMTFVFPDSPPVRLFDNLGTAMEDDLLRAYFRGAYLLDPFFVRYRETPGDWVCPLMDCAPDDFRVSDYYRAFYRETGLVDECGVLVRLGPEAGLLISLGLRDPQGCITPGDVAFLQAVLPLIATLCRRNWPAPAPDRIDRAADSGPGRMIAQAAAAFGTSVLSGREAETLHLLLQGHSSKSIARRMGNSPETVKAHRKRIYAKIGVATQGEVFARFLTALSATPDGFQGDPLTFARPVDPSPSDP